MRVTTKRSVGKSLLGITAADLMSAPITSIPHDMLLKEAGHLLIRSSITGAPVVDADGNCIGILSASDFVGWAEAGGEMEEQKAGVSFIAPWGEVVSLDACEGCIVSRFMTKQPVTVPATMPIGDVAKSMINAHIHRVLVSENNRPCGIISSIDIVAAVANAAQAATRRRKT